MANFEIIRDLCERNKITIRELASRIEKDESTIQSLIRKGSTNTSTLEEIAKVLGVPVGYFFDDNHISQQINVGGNAGGDIKMVGRDDNSKPLLCPQELQEAQREVASLKERLIQNEKLLEEKERTIQILLQK